MAYVSHAEGVVVTATRNRRTNRTTDRRTITAAAVGGTISGFFRAVVTWLLEQLQ